MPALIMDSPRTWRAKILVAAAAGVEGEIVLDALLRQNGAARGHVAHDGDAYPPGAPAPPAPPGGRMRVRRDGAALARALFDISGLLQMAEMEMHGGGGFEPHRLANLPHGGRVSLLPHAGGNVLVNLPLHFGKLPHHQTPFLRDRPGTGIRLRRPPGSAAVLFSAV
jgi:hypothetical protein